MVGSSRFADRASFGWCPSVKVRKVLSRALKTADLAQPLRMHSQFRSVEHFQAIRLILTASIAAGFNPSCPQLKQRSQFADFGHTYLIA